MCAQQSRIFIVTGLSGAGKSSVLHFLEDIGFFCVDNPPHSVIMQILSDVADGSLAMGKSIALGVDCRTRCDMQALADQLLAWRKKHDVQLEIVFLEAEQGVLLKRFQETRRKHPLAGTCDLRDAFKYEHVMLQPLRACADYVIPTGMFTIHQLRHLVRTTLAPDSKPKLLVRLMSFGFKYGVPPENNFVFDVRSLPNPYFIPELRPYCGKDACISEYLFAQQQVCDYWDRLHDFISFVLECSYKEGRFFVNIAVGCTGGHHRSVAFVERLATLPLDYVWFVTKHRDVARVGSCIHVTQERGICPTTI